MTLQEGEARMARLRLKYPNAHYYAYGTWSNGQPAISIPQHRAPDGSIVKASLFTTAEQFDSVYP